MKINNFHFPSVPDFRMEQSGLFDFSPFIIINTVVYGKCRKLHLV